MCEIRDWRVSNRRRNPRTCTSPNDEYKQQYSDSLTRCYLGRHCCAKLWPRAGISVARNREIYTELHWRRSRFKCSYLYACQSDGFKPNLWSRKNRLSHPTVHQQHKSKWLSSEDLGSKDAVKSLPSHRSIESSCKYNATDRLGAARSGRPRRNSDHQNAHLVHKTASG